MPARIWGLAQPPLPMANANGNTPAPRGDAPRGPPHCNRLQAAATETNRHRLDTLARLALLRRLRPCSLRRRPRFCRHSPCKSAAWFRCSGPRCRPQRLCGGPALQAVPRWALAHRWWSSVGCSTSAGKHFPFRGSPGPAAPVTGCSTPSWGPARAFPPICGPPLSVYANRVRPSPQPGWALPIPQRYLAACACLARGRRSPLLDKRFYARILPQAVAKWRGRTTARSKAGRRSASPLPQAYHPGSRVWPGALRP